MAAVLGVFCPAVFFSALIFNQHFKKVVVDFPVQFKQPTLEWMFLLRLKHWRSLSDNCWRQTVGCCFYNKCQQQTSDSSNRKISSSKELYSILWVCCADLVTDCSELNQDQWINSFYLHDQTSKSVSGNEESWGQRFSGLRRQRSLTSTELTSVRINGLNFNASGCWGSGWQQSRDTWRTIMSEQLKHSETSCCCLKRPLQADSSTSALSSALLFSCRLTMWDIWRPAHRLVSWVN